MPGALPARRMRRLAPRPSSFRGNAVNSNFMVRLPMSAAFPRSMATVVRGWRHPGGATSGPRPGKALNYNRKETSLPTRPGLGHVLAAVDLEDLTCDVSRQRRGREEQERARAFV